MSNVFTAPSITSEDSTIQWLALALTPGLGPTKARRIVEFFGSIHNLLAASLTELEAAGLHASSAQALGTGRSVELAHEQMLRASAAGVKLIGLEDAALPGTVEANLRSSAGPIFAWK